MNTSLSTRASGCIGWSIGLLVTVLLAGCSPSSSGPSAPPPVPVVVATAEKRDFLDLIEALGTVRANESVILTVNVTEKIIDLNFEDGQRVEEGDILLRLDDGEEQALINEANANLNREETQLRRVRDLVAANAMPKERLDEQQALYDIARARIQALEAILEDHTIRAPFSGILGLRNVSLGALLSPGDQITTLDDLSVVKVDFAVPEVFLASLQVGMTISARSAAYRDDTFEGEVISIDSRVDPVTRSVQVRAELPNPDLKLRPGMLLTLVLLRERVETLLIPEEAIIPVRDRRYVYIVKEDNTAERREVTTGRRRIGEVEILDGIKPGEIVVTEGAIRLRPGASVRITRETPINSRQELRERALRQNNASAEGGNES